MTETPLEKIAGQIPSAFAAIAADDALTVLCASGYFYDLLGIGDKAAGTVSLRGFVHADDLDFLMMDLKCSDAVARTMHARFLTPAGETKWITISACFYDGHYICSFADETAHVRSVAESEEARRELEGIANATHGGISKIVFKDRKITYLFLSNGLHFLSGYTPEDAEFYTVEAIIHPEDLQRVYTEIENQLEFSAFTVTFRVRNKDGSIRWIQQNGTLLDENDGAYTLICVYIDISASERARVEAEKERERLRIFVGVSDDVMFAFKPDTNTMWFSDKKLQEIGQDRDITIERFFEAYFSSNIIHPDHQQELRKMLTTGEPRTLDMLCKTAFSTREYRWFVIMGSALRDEDGRVTEVLGIMRDIHTQKLAELENVWLPYRDKLTGALGKEGMEKQVSPILSGLLEAGLLMSRPVMSALVFCDIRGFSGIVARMSDSFGDCILRFLVGDLERFFAKSCIIARLGADQFAVYVRNAVDERTVVEPAAEVSKRFYRIYKSCGRSEAEKIQLSVGAAFFPKDGESYSELLRSAQLAAFSARSNSERFGVTIYDEAAMGEQKQAYPAPVLKPVLSTAGEEHASKQLTSDLMNLLISAKRPAHALGAALGLLGVRFKAHRVVFYTEQSEDDKGTLRKRLEWRNGAPVGISALHFKSDYKAPFAESTAPYGVIAADLVSRPGETAKAHPYFDLPDTDLAQAVLIPMHDNGYIRGFVAFERMSRNPKLRMWQTEDLNEVGFFTNILCSYAAHLPDLSQPADGMIFSQKHADFFESLLYVVDCSTYEIIQVNNGLPGLVLPDDVKPGAICYRAFMQRGTVCPRCPLTGLKPGGKRKATLTHEQTRCKLALTATRQNSAEGTQYGYVRAEKSVVKS